MIEAIQLLQFCCSDLQVVAETLPAGETVTARGAAGDCGVGAGVRSGSTLTMLGPEGALGMSEWQQQVLVWRSGWWVLGWHWG